MTHQTTGEIREQLRGMALSLATGSGPLVEPAAFDAALDAYRAAVLLEGADAIDATFTGPGLDRYTRYGADLLRRNAASA